MKLYVAYGSNLNKEQMRHRCPDAKPVYTGYLENWELIYRGSKTGAYATIRRKKGYRVPVAVWNISETDERNLDIYEGYPRFYYKQNPTGRFQNKGNGLYYVQQSKARKTKREVCGYRL